MISRSTLAANALSLSFFFTLFGSSVAIPSGRTRQQAMMNPANSSQASRHLSIIVFGGRPHAV